MTTNECCICGKPRGLEQKRESWGLNCKNLLVPIDGKVTNQTMPHDLIVNAAIWRNGGSSEKTTHICDDCLRIGLRTIKIEISKLLNEFDENHDKDVEICEMSERLARLQFQHQDVCHDHNRMQDRLGHVLSVLDANNVDSDKETEYARYEVKRGHVKPNVKAHTRSERGTSDTE